MSIGALLIGQQGDVVVAVVGGQDARAVGAVEERELGGERGGLRWVGQRDCDVLLGAYGSARLRWPAG